ncbi:MAG: hypothetical protein WEF50_04090 [Myxococcota bacterium]
MRRAEGRIVEATLRFAPERFGADLIHHAWADFWSGVERPELSDDGLEREALFLPWLVFEWVARSDPEARRELGTRDLPRTPLAREYLAEHRSRLDAFEQQFLLAACASPLSFHIVGSVERGRGFAARDLMSGVENWVAEHAASESLRHGDAIFAKLVAHAGVTLQVGMGSTCIPPGWVGRVIDSRDLLAGFGGRIAADDLRTFEGELRHRYLELSHELHNPAPPLIRNTDGDELVPTTLRYALHCSAREAFDALATLSVVSTPEEQLESAELDANGALAKVEITWGKRGNRQMKSWDNTILGTVEVSGSELVVNVNSKKRARKIEREIRRRLGTRAKLEAKLHESLDDLLDRERERPTRPRDRTTDRELEEQPEIRELLDEAAREHWASWPDHELPALLGRAPREAARDPALRERLEALLVEFERDFRDPEFRGLPCDVAELRRRLGM